MINLEQDFLEFEAIGATAYYGYSMILDYGTQSNNWSIRQVLGTGSTLDVFWSNEKKFEFCSKWSDRQFYFQAPSLSAGSWTSSGVTWSTSKLSDSFVDFSLLQLRWDFIRGVDKYGIRIEDGSGRLLTQTGEFLYNTYVENPYTTVFEAKGTTNSTFNFRGDLGVTYSVEIEAFNGYGTISRNFQYYVI